MTNTAAAAGGRSLSVEQRMLIEQRVANEKKSVGVAYLLWFFLGLWGVHNFYLGKTRLAIFQLCGGVVSVIVLVVTGNHMHDPDHPGAGAAFTILIFVLVLVAWALSFFIDMFLIPRRVRLHSEELRRKYAATV